MLTDLQRQVVATLARLRGEGDYLAGGAVLNARHARLSDDLDIFLDDEAVVLGVARRDVEALRTAGFQVGEDIMTFGFAEATVRSKSGDETKLQWMQESAHRFFPLQRDPEFGFRLHDVDLAVNKAIAAASRKQARDVVDLVMIEANILRLGPLVWAAAESKTPMSPIRMLENILHNAVTHSAAEYRMVRSADPVDGADIVARVQTACEDARAFCRAAPIGTIGHIFVDAEGRPVSPTAEDIASGRAKPHGICERGAWPSFPGVEPPSPGGG